VRKLGWFYPPDPASLKECSIGGNLATNAGGPRCVKYGVTRHYVLGLEAVLADGTIVKAGGRCHKNKTGFDLGRPVRRQQKECSACVTEATLRLLAASADTRHAQRGLQQFRAMPRVPCRRILGSGFLPSAAGDRGRVHAEARRASTWANRSCLEGDAHLLVEIDGHEESGAASELKKLQTLVEGCGSHACRGRDGRGGLRTLLEAAPRVQLQRCATQA